MAIPSLWKQNDLKPAWTLELVPADGSTLNTSGLTPSNFTFIMTNISNRQNTTGTGTFSNLASGTPATIVYQPSATDVASLGLINAHAVANEGLTTQETLFSGVFEIVP
jgi:hypothetical protein